MVAAVALADNEHNGGAAVRAAVHPDVVYACYEPVYLLCRERVGIHAEHKPVGGKIELGVVFLRERVLHLTDVGAAHELPCSLFVVRRHDGSPHHHYHDGKSGGRPYVSLRRERGYPSARPAQALLRAVWDDVGELQAQGSEHMQDDEREHPSHAACDDSRRHARAQELARLACVGLADEHEHRGRERGLELHKAVYVDERRGVKCHIEQSSRPSPYGKRQQREHHAQGVSVEQQFEIKIVVNLGTLTVGQHRPRTYASERVHEKEERGVGAYRLYGKRERIAQCFHNFLHVMEFLAKLHQNREIRK